MVILKPVILVLGMPGSGKTTAGNELANHLKIPFRSMGNVLRAGRDSGIQYCYSNDPATSFLSAELQHLPNEFVNGLVLDFSPVTINGSEQLEEMFQKLKFNITWVIYIRINIEMAEKRCVSRGKRPGDPTEDMNTFFKNRILKEFWPFTIPMIRKACLTRKLLILDNRFDLNHLKDEVERVANVIQARRA